MFDVARFMQPPKKPKILRLWQHKNLRCRIVQGPFSINGYVGLPKNHPCYAKDYDDIDIEVHGGLTYRRKEPINPKDKEGEILWVVGFDTAHAFSGVWTEKMVVRETEKLAEQLAIMES